MTGIEMSPEAEIQKKPKKRRWKLPSLRKFIYLFHILNKQEKRKLLILFVLVLLSGGTLFGRLYLKMTIPVPALGKTLIEGALKEPRAINPIYATNDIERDLTKLIFSRLLTYDEEGKVLLDLAKNYEIGDAGKTYTVYLKEDVLWHDGQHLTANDILFTIKAIQNPAYKSPFIANWQGVSAEKVDEYTIRFSLRTNYTPFIENLSLGILPQHLWKTIGPDQAQLHELNLKPVGSGPYQFERLIQNKEGTITEYRLRYNSRYYRSGPYIKNFIFRFYDSVEKLLTAWRKGKIDAFSPNSSKVIGEFNKQKKRLTSIPTPRIFGIFFNQQKTEILRDKNVRKAIALALRRAEIIEKISGDLIPHDSPLPPNVSTFKKWELLHSGSTTKDLLNNSIRYSPNLDEAKKLLEKSGFRDENNDGILEKRGVKKIGKKTQEDFLPLRITLTTSDWPDLVKTAEVIQNNLKEVGIDTRIESKPLVELESSVIRSRSFEVLLFGQAYGYETDPFIFWHSSQIKDPGLNISLYANKKVDQVLEEIRRTADEKTKKDKLREFEKLVNEDIPAVFLFSQLYLYLAPVKLRGTNPQWISLPSDRFNEVNRWYLETDREFRRGWRNW